MKLAVRVAAIDARPPCDNPVRSAVDGVDRDAETGVITYGTSIKRSILGLQLRITPHISKDGVVSLNIIPTITRIQGEERVELPTRCA